MATGRPTNYTQELALAICERIASGATLRVLDAEDGMPSMGTIMRWARENDDFQKQYARAMEQRAEFWAEELLEIADDGQNDWMEKLGRDGETIGWIVNGEAVARSKLRAETRKWLMGKAAPKKYGDKVQLADPNDPTAPPTFTIKIGS
ncbi:terminase small subunit-like protein [Methylobacterium sp. Gmos1]